MKTSSYFCLSNGFFDTSSALLRGSSFFRRQIVSEHPPAVLIVVAIGTEVFPVGAIRGVISGVPVFMMDSQKVPVFRFKLSSAFGTDKAVYLKRLFPVIA